MNLHIGWRYYRENFAAFAVTIMTAIVVCNALVWGLVALTDALGGIEGYHIGLRDQPLFVGSVRLFVFPIYHIGAVLQPWVYLVAVLLVIVVLSVFQGINGALYRHGFDIMSSGDEFAEVRQSLHYFAENLGRFTIGSAVIVALVLVIQVPVGLLLVGLVAQAGSLSTWGGISVIAIGLTFSGFVTASMTTYFYPALVSRLKIRLALREALGLVRANWRQILLIQIFLISVHALMVGPLIAIRILLDPPHYVLVVYIIIEFAYFLVFGPLAVLMITRSYNAAQLRRGGRP